MLSPRITTPRSSACLSRAAHAAVLLLALTSVHHAYGALIYATPWRMKLLYFAIPAGAAILALARVSAARPGMPLGAVSRWLAVALILAFPVGMIGLFEGGYNHVVKNLLYFGWNPAVAARVFGGPAYEMPNDILFEFSGIAQFPVALLVITRLSAGMRRSRRTA